MDKDLHQYTVADFLEYRRAGRLDLNPDFQRRSVWKPAARVYLIDSILRGMPIPKIYFRTRIDPETQTSMREVVDGQQRLRAIFDFADGKLRLTSRANEFAGLRYSRLDDDLKAAFLAYTFAAEQLINATDDDVLELFARLNTYTVPLNKAELRHARWQGDFKWTVHETARRWRTLWVDFGIVTPAGRTRMLDDALMAQIFLLALQGITGGEAGNLWKAYKNFDEGSDSLQDVVEVVDGALQAIVDHLAPAITGPLANSPHFVMVFAATAHVLHGLPVAPVEWLPAIDMPEAPEAPADEDEWNQVADNLLEIATLIDQEEAPDDDELETLWRSSRGATITTPSREARFPFYLDAFNVEE